MKTLPKHHVYSLFLDKQSNDIMIFKGKKTFNVLLSGAITILFWVSYFVLVRTLPADAPNKEILDFAAPAFCIIATLLLLKFITTTEILTIRKPTQTATYEYRSFGTLYGWKRNLDEFISLETFTTMNHESGGAYTGNGSFWTFELTTKDNVSIPIYPSLVHIPAKNREKALDFAQKISEFMDVENKVAS